MTPINWIIKQITGLRSMLAKYKQIKKEYLTDAEACCAPVCSTTPQDTCCDDPSSLFCKGNG